MMRSQTTNEARRGVVLLSTLVVIVLLSLAAYQYSDLMLSEYKASTNAHRIAQARAFADSGVHYAAAILSDPEQIDTVLNGNLFDNADAFRNVEIAGAKGAAGRFSLLAPADPEGGNAEAVRYGLVDESGKINVNAVMKRDSKGQLLYDMLLKLPNVTEEIAASITDWLDGDTEPRANGAESDYYSGEMLPYRAKNGPIDSIDELLLVKGITPEILFGNDLNRNGIQDPEEDTGTNGFERGLSAYLTIYSREQNTDSLGQALTYINEDDLGALFEKLAPGIGDDMAKFIVMYRQYGPANSSGKQQSLLGSLGAIFSGGKSNQGKGKGGKNKTPEPIQGKLSSFTPDFSKKSAKKVSSFFDLVSAQVSIPGKKKDDPAVIYSSPLADPSLRRAVFPKLFEHATIYQESDIPARININTAPREVLTTLEDLTEADVQQIMTLRPQPGAASDTIYDTLAWLLTEANMKTDMLKKIESSITTRSQVYRVHVLGFFDEKGPAARVEAVIDANSGRPRIVYWRDVSELGARPK